MDELHYEYAHFGDDDVMAGPCKCGLKEPHFHIEDSGPICGGIHNKDAVSHPDWCIAEHWLFP